MAVTNKGGSFGGYERLIPLFEHRRNQLSYKRYQQFGLGFLSISLLIFGGHSINPGRGKAPPWYRPWSPAAMALRPGTQHRSQFGPDVLLPLLNELSVMFLDGALQRA